MVVVVDVHLVIFRTGFSGREGGGFIVVSLESTLDVCAKTKVEGRGCHMGGGVRIRMRVSQAAAARPPPAAKR